MFKKIKKLLGIHPEILIIKPSSMTKEEAQRIGNQTGKIVVYSEDENAVKKVVLPEEGDGKAEFFGEGDHDEFKEQEKKDRGLSGIFGGIPFFGKKEDLDDKSEDYDD